MRRARHLPSLARAGLVAIALIIAAHYAWNAWTVTPLTGYDAPGHAAYMFTILEEGRLPDPYQGWSTFHPPIYYVLGAGVWRALEPLGPQAVVAGIRSIGVISLLAIGLLTFNLARRRTSDSVAATATAVMLLVPCVQMTGAMIRNEALAAAFATGAIPLMLALQRDPRRNLMAAAAGVLLGLAIATKVNAAYVLVGCALPFLRRDLDRRGLRSALLLFGLATAIAAPVTVRNLMLTGDPLPLNRDKPVARFVEASQVISERRLTDFLWIDPRCLWRPSIHQVPGDPPPPPPRRNTNMTNVWGLAYAGTWYDAFGHRIPVKFHRDGVIAGRLLALLGLIPTAAMLAGFLLATAEAVRRRGRSQDAPLVAMSWSALLAFVYFISVSPTIGAPKTLYLLPVVTAAPLFFIRFLSNRGPRVRASILAASATAALCSALVFTQSLWFPPIGPEVMAGRWRLVGAALPGSHIETTLDRLVAER